MKGNFLVLLAVACLALLLATGGSPWRPQMADEAVGSQSSPLSSEQIREIVRAAADKDVENFKREVNYTYVEHEREEKLDSQGQVKSTETRTYEIMIFYGQPVQKLVARNGEPLPPDKAKKEDERIQKIIDLRKNENEKARAKRLADQEKGREEDREFVKEIADAYDFHYVGAEELDGRNTYVIDADPRPDFTPQNRQARFLPDFRFRAWVDQVEKQWVKLDIQCIKTVSVGLFLFRVHKGSSILAEQTRVNDEVWLPKHIAVRLNARVALVKGVNMAMDLAYSDYKKFRTETKILPGDSQE